MMKKLLLVFLLITLAAPSVGYGQKTVESLQKEIKKAEEEIRKNTALLKKNQNDRKVSESQLKLIQSRISNRKSIINSLEEQINIISKDIDSKNGSISNLNKDLGKLRADYAAMMRNAYKQYKLNSFLVFLFSSSDFNDATKRVAFMQRYNKMRVEKAVQIDSVSRSLAGQVSELDTKLSQLDKVKASRNEELKELAKDQQQYQKSVASLKASESKLSNAVKAKQKVIADAQKQIERIVAEEARKAKNEKRTAEEDKYITQLSGRFDQNKGKLPFPVSGGVIIDQYGIHAHPTQKGLKVNNKGVNIAANKGAEVRCVFEGVVTRIFFFQGLNNSVMIRHGNYITVYSNLAAVSVKTGDKVTLNQKLGNLSTGNDTDEHMLHFEIWKETENLNPSHWLRR